MSDDLLDRTDGGNVVPLGELLAEQSERRRALLGEVAAAARIVGPDDDDVLVVLPVQLLTAVTIEAQRWC